MGMFSPSAVSNEQRGKMRSVRRRLFNIASLISLLLCVGCTMLGVRSWIIADQFEVGRGSKFGPAGEAVRSFGVMFSRGNCYWCLAGWTTSDLAALNDTLGRPTTKSDIGWQIKHEQRTPDVTPSVTSLATKLGFGFRHDNFTQGNNLSNAWYVSIPVWLITTTAAILPICFFRRRSAVRRTVAFKPCASCGYNLTGNTSGVCPECGTKIEPERRSSNAKSAESTAQASPATQGERIAVYSVV
jgi:predicted RNA-binding Zn-ribbon protein involved in translation (DUF1610 family)